MIEEKHVAMFRRGIGGRTMSICTSIIFKEDVLELDFEKKAVVLETRPVVSKKISWSSIEDITMTKALWLTGMDIVYLVVMLVFVTTLGFLLVKGGVENPDAASLIKILAFFVLLIVSSLFFCTGRGVYIQMKDGDHAFIPLKGYLVKKVEQRDLLILKKIQEYRNKYNTP